MNIEILAACDCKKVRFKSQENPIIQVCCHCEDCRDSLKSDFATTAFFEVNSTEIWGNTVEKTYTANSGKRTTRESCSSCGVVMFDKSEGFPSVIGVMTKQIDAPFEVNPSCHMWVSSKLPHVVIPAGMPKHEDGIK